jgi:pyridoxamine 5'-phosphate oxidase
MPRRQGRAFLAADQGLWPGQGASARHIVAVEAEQAIDAIPDGDPITLFGAWYAEAWEHEPNDANAMALATATPQGTPSLRMVLLKGHGPEGFTFYTNGHSRKGREIAANPHAALLFHWKSLRRQIRIEGPLAAVDAAEADAYFRQPRARFTIGRGGFRPVRPAR